MAIDMTQFYQVFFEETEEHLASMEALLLGLDLNQPDSEALNAIFRAAHSIKGSSGTFGFDDLAQVTHILENLLDRIRHGELVPDSAMVEIFLDAGDVLKSMLQAHRGQGTADPAASERICARLAQLSGPPQAEVLASQPLIEPDIDGPYLRVSFILDDADNDAVADVLLKEFACFGKVHLLARGGQANPVWQLAIEGDSVEGSEIRDSLEFVARSDSIRIENGGTAAVAATKADDDYGFFDPLPVAESAAVPAAADEGFGFFEPLPAVALEDDSFGLFEPLAGEDDSYGFFAPLPEPAATGSAADADDGSYGFFTDLPTPEPVPATSDTHAPVSSVTAPPKAPLLAPSVGEASIRVGVDKVDQLVNLVGELVITQAMLAQAASQINPADSERLLLGLEQLERNMRDLQGAVLSIRMLPISTVFSRFPRVVHDLSLRLAKDVRLKLVGEGTELDKGLIEKISDPLTHLVRNSLDHGIETPALREAAGKPRQGTITLKAYHQGGNVVIEVADDGAGLNRQRILAKAAERGLPADPAMSDQEVWQLIFEPGFSTAAQITDVSGRGVGMDVVKRNIAEMGGRVDIQSTAGAGSCMTVRLPLTLAILDGMSVSVGRETYLLPLNGVVESLQVQPAMVKRFAGVDRLIQLRDEYLPVIALHEVFAVTGAQHAFEQGIMVVVEAQGSKAALFVDALLGQSQVVIKSLESNFRKVDGVSGATIMGDGRVALILDVPALVALAHSAMPPLV